MVIQPFFNKATGWGSISRIAKRKLDILHYAAELGDLKAPPGNKLEILQEEFLLPLGISQKRLADHLGYDVKVINRIVNNRSSVTVEMAVKLGKEFNTSPQFWLNAQQTVDIYKVLKNHKDFPQPIVRTS